MLSGLACAMYVKLYMRSIPIDLAYAFEKLDTLNKGYLDKQYIIDKLRELGYKNV